MDYELKATPRLTYWRQFIFPHVREDARNIQMSGNDIVAFCNKWMVEEGMVPSSHISYSTRPRSESCSVSVRSTGIDVKLIKKKTTADVAAFLAARAIEGYHGLEWGSTRASISPFYLNAWSIMMEDFGFNQRVLLDTMQESKCHPFPYEGGLKGLIATFKLLDEFAEKA